VYSRISGSGRNIFYILVTREATIECAILPTAAFIDKVRLVPTPLITEDSPKFNEGIDGGLAIPGSLSDGERHYSTIMPAADIFHEAQVVSTPVVTKESPLANKDVAATLANPTQRVKSLPDFQERAQLTQTSLDNAIPPLDAANLIKPTIVSTSGQISIMSKKQGGVPGCTIDDALEKDADEISMGNHSKINSVRKNKKLGGVLSFFQVRSFLS